MLQQVIQHHAFHRCQETISTRLDMLVRLYQQLKPPSTKLLGEMDAEFQEAFLERYEWPYETPTFDRLESAGCRSDGSDEKQGFQDEAEDSDHNSLEESNNDCSQAVPDEIPSQLQDQEEEDGAHHTADGNEQDDNEGQSAELDANVPSYMKHLNAGSRRENDNAMRPSSRRPFGNLQYSSNKKNRQQDMESNASQAPHGEEEVQRQQVAHFNDASMVRQDSERTRQEDPKPPSKRNEDSTLPNASSNDVSRPNKQRRIARPATKDIITNFWDGVAQQGNQTTGGTEAPDENPNETGSAEGAVELPVAETGNWYQDDWTSTLDGEELRDSDLDSKLIEVQIYEGKDHDSHSTKQANNTTTMAPASPAKTKEMMLLARFGLLDDASPDALPNDGEPLSSNPTQSSEELPQNNQREEPSEEIVTTHKASTEESEAAPVPAQAPTQPPPMLYEDEESSQIFFNFPPQGDDSDQEDTIPLDNAVQATPQSGDQKVAKAERKRKRKKDKKKKKKHKKRKKETIDQDHVDSKDRQEEDDGLEIPRKMDFLELSPVKPVEQPEPSDAIDSRLVSNASIHAEPTNPAGGFDEPGISDTQQVPTGFDDFNFESASQVQQPSGYVWDFEQPQSGQASYAPPLGTQAIQDPYRPETIHDTYRPEPMQDAYRPEPICLLCSESFLEGFSTVVADLARGDRGGGQIRPIRFLDTSFVDSANVNLELPDGGAVMILSTSELQLNGLKGTIEKVLAVATSSKYKFLEVFMLIDLPVDGATSNMMCRLQNAVIQNEGLPATSTRFKITTPASLSTSIAKSILSVTVDFISSETEQRLSDEMTRSRISFLLDLIPNLSVTGAVQWLGSDVDATNPQLSSEEKVANWFRRALGGADLKRGRLGGSQALTQHVATQLQFVVKAMFMPE
ncbi:MAG: hypothetical protein SGILL_005110 [Bacillariaceae sp.]